MEDGDKKLQEKMSDIVGDKSEPSAFELQLNPWGELEEELMEEVLRTDKRAMRILAPRDHAISELRRKLIEKQFEKPAVEIVIARYVKEGWLDDARFADYQAMLLADREWGPNKIREKLRARGVDSNTISAAVAKLDIDFFETAKTRCERRFSDLTDKREKARAFRHLKGRGYSEQMARKIVFAK